MIGPLKQEMLFTLPISTFFKKSSFPKKTQVFIFYQQALSLSHPAFDLPNHDRHLPSSKLCTTVQCLDVAYEVKRSIDFSVNPCDVRRFSIKKC